MFINREYELNELNKLYNQNKVQFELFIEEEK